MSLSQRIEILFRKLLPSPFSIAWGLTFLTILLALFFGDFNTETNRTLYVFEQWEKGLWKVPLMNFLVQMMLMLVLGHILALSKTIDILLNRSLSFLQNGAQAAGFVTVVAVVVSLFNWGLGLIVGAVLARKIGEYAQKKNIPINYPLIAAGAYSGLMVWHGGISGSAPVKAAEDAHLKELMTGIIPQEKLSILPDSIDYSQTIFSNMNIAVSITVIICLPLLMYFVSKRTKLSVPNLTVAIDQPVEKENDLYLAERLDQSPIFIKIIGSGVLLFWLYKSIALSPSFVKSINPNHINLFLLGASLLLHKNIQSFLNALNTAIGGASGILIQFPLYFGIMGIMNGCGLVQQISEAFVSISTDFSFPLYTFMSAGLVNIFVPSGGGQWAVQGPIIVQAVEQLQGDLSKAIMALSYGDQLTNMLQPFWALPLLGITKLKANQILPYTLILFLAGVVIFGTALILF
mgnify:CR=1 FL=1